MAKNYKMTSTLRETLAPMIEALGIDPDRTTEITFNMAVVDKPATVTVTQLVDDEVLAGIWAIHAPEEE